MVHQLFGGLLANSLVPLGDPAIATERHLGFKEMASLFKRMWHLSSRVRNREATDDLLHMGCAIQMKWHDFFNGNFAISNGWRMLPNNTFGAQESIGQDR